MNREHGSPLTRQRIKEQEEQQSGKQKRKSADDRLTAVRSGKNYTHSSKLSPLPKKEQGNHEEQQEKWKNPRGQEGSNSISPRGSKTSVTKEYPSGRRNNKNENVLHPGKPLVPSGESKITANSYTQAEIPFSSSNVDGNSNLLLSRFVPLTERCASPEVETTSNGDEFYGKNKEEFDTSSVFGEFLTDDMLREWTGWEDLHLVLTAEMHLDAVRTLGVDTISERMPLLHSLRLNNSRIPQIRLLGTKFMNLKRLWIRGSRIGCLRGIGACAPLLEELYASFNSVRDITPLLDLSDTLEVVDFEGNEIHDSNMLLRCLPLLRKVKYLTLQGNPVEISYYNSQEESSNATERSFSASTSFREFVRSLMPDLHYLNDIPFTENNSNPHSSASRSRLIQPNSSDNHAEEHKEDASLVETTTPGMNHVDPVNVSLCDEYMFLQQCIRECGFDALDAAVEDETRSLYTRPQTSCAGARPRLSSLPSQLNNNARSCNSANAAGRRPLNSQTTRMPFSSTFPPNASNVSSGTSTGVPSPCTSSLTVGRPMMGGGAVSLRRRLPPLHPQPTFIPHTASGTESSSSKSFHSARSGGDGGNGEASDVQFTPTSTPVRRNHLSLDTPLFEEEEDEWELYKQSLLRRGEAQSANSAQRWIKYVGSESANSSHGEPENVGLSSGSYSTSARTTSASSNPATLRNNHHNHNHNNNSNHTVNDGHVTALPSQSISSTNMTVLPSTSTQIPTAAIAIADSVESCAASVEVSPDGKSSNVRDMEEKGKREKQRMNEDEIREEEEWRQELLRSVARSRTRTARAGMSGKSLRLGDVSNNDMVGFEILDSGDVEFGIQ